MNPKDVAIVDFNFFPGIKGPTVKAMAHFTFEGVEKPQIAWVELKQDEIAAVVAVEGLVEHRLLTGESPLPEPIQKGKLGFRTSEREKD